MGNILSPFVLPWYFAHWWAPFHPGHSPAVLPRLEALEQQARETPPPTRKPFRAGRALSLIVVLVIGLGVLAVILSAGPGSVSTTRPPATEKSWPYPQIKYATPESASPTAPSTPHSSSERQDK
jgi:hypothetical protein